MMVRLLAMTFSTLLLGGVSAGAQGLPPTAATTPASSTAPEAAASFSPSGLVRPAVVDLQQALGMLHVDKWKLSKSVREATVTNIGSIRKDLDNTLPGLLTTADATPTVLSGILPVSRNLGALYDVVLRVAVIAESSAPQEQAATLEQAMSSLEGVRRSLSDRTQGAALALEQQVRDLQKTLAARPLPVAAPPTPPAPETKTPAKKKKRPVPAAKPANQ